MDIEQLTLLWIFRIIFLLFSIVLAGLVWQFMRRPRVVSLTKKKPYTPPNIKLPSKNIILSLISRPGKLLSAIDIFNAMDKIGLKMSENGIFEYILDDGKTIAFSITNIRNNGIFYADIEANKPTNGLVAYMLLPVLDGNSQYKYFHILLSVLEQLRLELNCSLCDDMKRPIKNKELYKIQQEIEIFEQSYCSYIQRNFTENN